MQSAHLVSTGQHIPCANSVSKAVAVAAWLALTSASSAPTSADVVGVPNSDSGSASGSGARSGLAPETEARRRLGVRLGIQIWPRRPKTRSSYSTRKGSRQLRATLSWMSGESRDLPHAAGAFDLFLGGLPQQTVASVDHRETPQQFDRWQPLISIEIC